MGVISLYKPPDPPAPTARLPAGSAAVSEGRGAEGAVRGRRSGAGCQSRSGEAAFYGRY